MAKNSGKNANKTVGFIPMIKTISGSIRQYKTPSILAPIFIMMEVVLECFIPLIMTYLLGAIEYVTGQNANPKPIVKNIVDFLTNGSPKNANLLMVILAFGLTLIFIAFLSLTCGALSGKFCAVASSGFAKNLRKDMYYKIQDFSFSNIDKFSTSSLVTRLTTDVANVEMSYMMIIRTAVRSPFMLIFSMIMAFSINPKMALIFLATAPILAISLVLIITKAVPFFNKIFKRYDAMNESVEENIRAMRVVKSYVREDYEKEKFNKASSNVKNDFIKAEKLIALNTPIMNFCVYAGLISIYIVGSIFILKDNQRLLQLTELQSFMSYSFQILMSLMMLSMILVTLTISAASAKRISEVLTEESDIVSPKDAIKTVENGEIEFENVNFKYKSTAEKYTLADINLKINSGETVGIIGATGSSKSTLVSLIPRLYDVSTGEVKVAGKNVKDYDLDSLRNSVAMVLQKNVLFSGTILENMRWGNPNATEEEVKNACELAQADEFIRENKDGYNRYIDQGGVNVSGGQKQRLCIARALLKKPKILILDDSTSAVDTKTDALIRKAFKEYIPETTKIIIAQRIASVQDADKIIIMENGKIVAVGNHNELLNNNDIYSELYYSQNKIENEKEVK